MKVSYRWLREYVKTDLAPAEIASRLVSAGVEVGSVTPLGIELSGVVVARVEAIEEDLGTSAAGHRLLLCRVKTASQEFSVVSGAPNVTAGTRGAFAPPGARLFHRSLLAHGRFAGPDVAARTEPAAFATTALGLFAIDVSTHGVIRTTRTSIGTDATSHVHLAGVRVGERSRCDDGARVTWPSIVAALDNATIVAAAELAGLARGALDAAVAYAKAREQFGAPIATYQALAHRLADMAIDTESAELAVEEAAGAPTPQNASRAKVIANEAAYRVTAGLHQINGGVGFYADQTPPAYYARALALRVEMGDSSIHRLRLATQLA